MARLNVCIRCMLIDIVDVVSVVGELVYVWALTVLAGSSAFFIGIGLPGKTNFTYFKSKAASVLELPEKF